MRQKIELIEQELGRWRTGEAVPPSEQTALGEELPLCDQVRQATEIFQILITGCPTIEFPLCFLIYCC